MSGLISLAGGFLLGMLAENAAEWALHKYVLHGLGRSRQGFWSFHWHQHHRVARRNGMLDPGYRGWPLRWNTQGKEALLLLLGALAHLPLLWVQPGYVAGVYVGLICYYFRHRRAHLDPAWARRHLPWHYEHHMGRNPNANWCTAWPWFDWLMGTRDTGEPRRRGP